MQEIVVIDGEISLENTLDGEVELEAITDLDPEVVLSTGGAVYPHYSGSYIVTPSGSVQTLDTSDKVMDDDVTIQAVTQGSATTPATIITANPSISVSSGGLITATVSKTQQITPTVIEGYVSAGTAGNIGVSGSNTEQLSTQAAQTIHPSTSDQSIASGKYLTGAQTIKAVTVSGLSADKVLTGTTVEIGDSDDSDRIMKVVGTASGGITPTGTKQITANGQGIDVYSYQYADVAVPNSYSAGDEGKVVSNGALVAQTSDTVTANDTYDTTLINSLTVNVSGGGGISVDDLAGNTAPSGAITLGNGVTTIKTYAFANKPITSITAPSVTLTESNALIGTSITAITDSNFPSITTNSCFFNNMTSLLSIKLTGMKTLSSGSSQIRGDTNLVTAEFPSCNTSVGGSCFYGDSKLELCDLGEATSIGNSAFYNCSKLSVLILRRSSICALGNINAFSGSPFKSGGTGGTIYIPKALYDHLGDNSSLDYQKATNWSTIYGYGTITWAKIEGSIYELT